jgi:hypothetical protein
MPKFGSVVIDDGDVHPVKEKIKVKLGNVAGLSGILSRKGASNFDFWVAGNGTLWIGENGSGGKQKETTLNFFTAFPAYAPETSDLPSNRPADWDPYAGLDDSDSES